jgi:uncharacterized membrane protein YfcA
LESGLALTPELWAGAAAALFVAGITQGALGFGFPSISTPLLMLMTDVKTAIILNLLPNFTVNAISVVSGGRWSESLGRYWPVAAWVMAGSFLGASFLILAPQEPVRLLLAIAIFAYLGQQRLAHLDWSWLARRPRLSAAVFGLTGGFFSGSVNNSLPPLLVYFTVLGLEVTAMTQILNLCFLGGKVMQVTTLGAAGEIALAAVIANVPLTLVALAGMWIGARLQRHISKETYNRLLRWTLFAIALVLAWQGAQYFLR